MGESPNQPAARRDAAAGGYQELQRRVHAAGLLNRSYRYYSLVIAGIAVGLALVGFFLARLPGIGDVLAVPALALLMMQLGFLGHDAGHNGVFHRARHNQIVGLIAYPAMLGLSFENWVAKHNAHHLNPNQIGSDPDIENTIVAFTPEAAASRRGLLRWIARHQAYLYFVLAMFASFGFRIDAWRHVISERNRSSTCVELGLLGVNLLTWYVAPALLLGPVRWLLVYGVTLLVVGVYMASVFAPNHKGMPFVRGKSPSFLERQILTARNVRGGPVTDFLYGGLNDQIEHHLFPWMARNRLPECRKLVREFCAEAGFPHAEDGVIASYRSLLTYLHTVGRGGEVSELE